MKIFIDTAKLDEIQEANSWGIVDGVTTNPSLIKKAMDALDEPVAMEEYIASICAEVDGPVSLETMSRTTEMMVDEAETLYETFNDVHNNVVVKIPVNTAMEEDHENYEGVKAIKILEDEGIPINATLVMSPNQALLAAKAGASYVSPFLGRVDDYIRSRMGLERGEDYAKTAYFDEDIFETIRVEKRRDMLRKRPHEQLGKLYLDERITPLPTEVNSGVDLVRKTKRIFENYEFSTAIIAASIRNARQVVEVAEIGAEIATIPFNVISDMIWHYKTREGMKAFTEDVIPEYKVLFEE